METSCTLKSIVRHHLRMKCGSGFDRTFPDVMMTMRNFKFKKRKGKGKSGNKKGSHQRGGFKPFRKSGSGGKANMANENYDPYDQAYWGKGKGKNQNSNIPRMETKVIHPMRVAKERADRRIHIEPTYAGWTDQDWDFSWTWYSSHETSSTGQALMAFRYHTTPPCSTNIDVLEQGTVPILLNISQMRNLYMTIEHTPQCDKITCKAFGMNRQAVPVSGTGHALVDLAGVARVKAHGEMHTRASSTMSMTMITASSFPPGISPRPKLFVPQNHPRQRRT